MTFGRKKRIFPPIGKKYEKEKRKLIRHAITTQRCQGPHLNQLEAELGHPA